MISYFPYNGPQVSQGGHYRLYLMEGKLTEIHRLILMADLKL